MSAVDKVVAAARQVVENWYVGAGSSFASVPTAVMDQLEAALTAYEAQREELKAIAKKQATQLRRGLRSMPTTFSTEICIVCEGKGEHDQQYTLGCGGGYGMYKGVCSCCDGKGLLQGGKPAPDSVLAQVLTAAGD